MNNNAIKKRKIRVLLLSEDRSQVSALQDSLAELDAYSVDSFYVKELSEALKKVSSALFDFILLDLNIIDEDNYQALDELTHNAPGVPVIVITSEDKEDFALKSLQRGAHDYIVRNDWNPTLLQRIIRYAIARKQSEEQIAKLAHYDALTGVANRHLFRDRLSQAIFRAERSGKYIAVLFLDLDHFHGVNETLGYEVGDMLLKEASAKIVKCVRRQDTVARIGGDEFAVILEGLLDPQDATVISRQILESFKSPSSIANQPIFISTSIGISVSEEFECDASTLIKQADIARYRAKEQGRNNFQYFMPELNEIAQKRLHMEQELSQTLARIFKQNP
ncbi:MAG: GGDEF domain-containing response regulator [Pseudomonadales bacterium]|nr:GGDEF domain-containing response regulator [Pseudomonadales bacterium]